MGVCGPAFFAPTTLDPSDTTLEGIAALLDHWWTFDDVLTDSISTSAEGALTWSGAGAYVASTTGKKYDNSALLVASPANALKTSNWSIGGRFTFNSVAQNTFFCSRSADGGSYERVYLQLQPTGALTVGLHTGSAFVSCNSAAGLITASSTPRSVVGTYDGAMLRLYVDGELVASLATTAAPALTQVRLEIGYAFTSNVTVDNDELFIARQALTLGQVRGLHNGGAGAGYALVLYPTLTTLTIAGTLAPPQESTTQSSAFAPEASMGALTWSISAGALPAGLSLNPSTGVIAGFCTALSGTAYSFTLRVVDANGKAGTRAFSGTVANANAWEAAVSALALELWLRGNETAGATAMADASGNARHAAISGTPVLDQPGLFANTGRSVQFGTNRYARAASVAGLQFSTADFIVGVAFMRTATGDGQYGKLVWKTANYSLGYANYLLQYGRDSNQVTARVSHAGNNYFDVTDPTAYALNTPYLVFLRRLGAEISLWRNGVKVAAANLPSSSTALLTTADPVDFMGGPTNSTDVVNGYGDELIIARGSVSDATMAALWAARTPHSVRTRWRINVSATETGGGGGISIAELQFREAPGSVSLATGGTATASSTYPGGYSPANAFDGNAGTFWPANDLVPGWLRYDLPTAKTVQQVAILSRNPTFGQSPTAFTVESSADGTTWNVEWAATSPSGWGANEWRSFTRPAV